MKVGYLGPKGTFTEKIALQEFPENTLVPLKPIRKVIEAVDKDEVDFGIVPLENFYNGEVRETLDSLTETSGAKIVKELSIKIVHCLGALANHSEIKKILSKDQALEQCSAFLCENYPDAETMAVSSTSEAVEKIKSENLLDSAAIASEKSLVDSSLQVLSKDLCPNNKTRFVVVGKEIPKSTGDDKTFLAIHPPIKDQPGVLQNVLGFFAGLGINLENIQSRPDGKKGYYFYVELDGHVEDEKVVKAIESIKLSLNNKKEHPETVKILGSYKNTNWKDDN